METGVGLRAQDGYFLRSNVGSRPSIGTRVNTEDVIAQINPVVSVVERCITQSEMGDGE
jgi:hypothetical protein